MVKTLAGPSDNLADSQQVLALSIGSIPFAGRKAPRKVFWATPYRAVPDGPQPGQRAATHLDSPPRPASFVCARPGIQPRMHRPRGSCSTQPELAGARSRPRSIHLIEPGRSHAAEAVSGHLVTGISCTAFLGPLLCAERRR
jgi:hypothetical protein